MTNVGVTGHRALADPDSWSWVRAEIDVAIDDLAVPLVGISSLAGGADQVFAEARERSYDLIVTGSSRATGMLRHYIMGDLTRTILNHANCPVLVARAGAIVGPRGLWRSIRRAFAAKTAS